MILQEIAETVDNSGVCGEISESSADRGSGYYVCILVSFPVCLD